MLTKKIATGLVAIIFLTGLVSFASANPHSLHEETTPIPLKIEWNSQVEESYTICFNAYHNYGNASYCINLGEQAHYTVTTKELQKIHNFYDEGQTQLMIGWSIYWEVLGNKSIEVLDSGRIDYNEPDFNITINTDENGYYNPTTFSPNKYKKIDVNAETDFLWNYGGADYHELCFSPINSDQEHCIDSGTNNMYTMNSSDWYALYQTFSNENTDEFEWYAVDIYDKYPETIYKESDHSIVFIDFSELQGASQYKAQESDFYIQDELIDDDYWDKVDFIISDEDWDTLSMKQIDEKLIAAGLEPFGDPENDDFYSYSGSEIDTIFSTMETERLEELGVFISSDADEIDKIISDEDWDTLSMKQIDEKLNKNNHPPIGDENDPLYFYTPAEIDAFTDDDWDILFQGMIESLTFDNEIDKIISDEDWNTLSMEQIDEKLNKNNHPPIGDKNDPLYFYTPAEIDAFTDNDWKELDKDFEAFFNSFE